MDDITRIWPEWETEGLIGEGPISKVYLVRTTQNGEKYYAAVKVLSVPPEQYMIDAAKQQGITDDMLKSYFAKFREELNWEVTMMKAVSSGNIAAIEAVTMEDDSNSIGWTCYLRSAVYTPLVTYFKMNTPDENTIIRLGTELCDALTAASDYGVVHGDIKPENILVMDSGAFVLSDFGIRKCLEKAGSALFRNEKKKYAAPEVECDGRYSAASDIYSLGLVMYSAVNGWRLPENGIITDLPGVSGELMEILKKALAVNPVDRYRTAGEFKAALEHLRYQQGVIIRASAVSTALAVSAVNGERLRRMAEPKSADSAGVTDATLRARQKNGEKLNKSIESSKKKDIGKKNNRIVAAAVGVILAIMVVVIVILILSVFGGDSDSDDAVPTVTPIEELTEETPDETDSAEAEAEDDETPAVSEEASEDSEESSSGGEEDSDGMIIVTVAPDSDDEEAEDDSSSSAAASATAASSSSSSSAATAAPTATPTAEPTAAPTESVVAVNNYYILANSNSDYITEADLEGLTETEVLYAINEIYARHGKIFKTASIQNYFLSQQWYEPDESYDESVDTQFNEYEQANVNFISEYQTAQGWRD